MAAQSIFLASYGSGTAATIYSVPAVPLGAPSPDRVIVVALGHRAATDTTATVTIGGNPMTLLRRQAISNTIAALFWASVPTGDTSDVVVTFSASNVRYGVSIYAVTGAGSNPVFDTAGNGSTVAGATVTSNLTASGPGAVVAAFHGGNNVGQHHASASGLVAVSGSVTVTVKPLNGNTTSTAAFEWGGGTVIRDADLNLTSQSQSNNAVAFLIAYDAPSGPIAALSEITLGNLAIAGTGMAPISAAASVPIAEVVAGGAGAARITAAAAPELTAITAQTAGALPLAGRVALAIGNVQATAAGSAPVSAACSIALGTVAAGALAWTGIAGSAACRLGNVASEGRGGGSASLSGALSASVGAVRAGGTGRIRVSAAVGSSLGYVAAAGAGQPLIQAVVAGQLGRVAADIAGTQPLHGVTAVSLGAIGITAAGAFYSSTPVLIAPYNCFVVPARQRFFIVPARQRAFIICRGTSMSISRQTADERQYQADWTADLNGQQIVGEIAATSSDPALIVDRLDHDGAIMTFWLAGGRSGRVATIEFLATTSGGEKLPWEQTVVCS